MSSIVGVIHRGRQLDDKARKRIAKLDALEDKVGSASLVERVSHIGMTAIPSTPVTKDEISAWITFIQGLRVPRWYVQFEGGKTNKMQEWICLLLLFYFTVWKYITWTVMLVAFDPEIQNTYYGTVPPVLSNSSCCPKEVLPWLCDAKQHTPFQEHAHQFGDFFQFSVSSHMISAFALVSVCLVPLFVSRGHKWHRVFGRIFVAFWVWHMFDGLYAACMVLLQRGYQTELYPLFVPDECGDTTDNPGRPGFSLWLYVQFAFIAQATLDFLCHGLMSIQYKTTIPNFVKWPLVVGNVLTMAMGFLYVGLGLAILADANQDRFDLGDFNGAAEYGVVFIVQCPAYVALLGLQVRYLLMSAEERSGAWSWEHKRSMIFVVCVTIVTFTANVTFRLAGMGKPVCTCSATPPAWSSDCSYNGLSSPTASAGAQTCAEWQCSTECAAGFPDLTAIAWFMFEVSAFTYWALTAKKARQDALKFIYSSRLVQLWNANELHERASDVAAHELRRLEECQREVQARERKGETTVKDQRLRRLGECIELLRDQIKDENQQDFLTAYHRSWGELINCCGAHEEQERVRVAVRKHQQALTAAVISLRRVRRMESMARIQERAEEELEADVDYIDAELKRAAHEDSAPPVPRSGSWMDVGHTSLGGSGASVVTPAGASSSHGSSRSLGFGSATIAVEPTPAAGMTTQLVPSSSAGQPGPGHDFGAAAEEIRVPQGAPSAPAEAGAPVYRQGIPSTEYH